MTPTPRGRRRRRHRLAAPAAAVLVAALWASCGASAQAAAGGSTAGVGSVRAASPEQLLWRAVQRSTGMSEVELRHAAEQFLELPAPSEVGVWSEHMRCGAETCAGELAARLVATLGQAWKLPLRFFEPFRGDPLFELWQREDSQVFHSWADGQAAERDASLKYLMPEGQPLAIGRKQAARFMELATERISGIVGLRPGALGRCVEWDTPFYAVKGMLNLCTKYDILVYADGKAGRSVELREYQMGTRVMQMDVLDPPPWTPTDYGAVICFFVVEHIPRPLQAMQTIARMMANGGFLLLGAPFLDGVHGCPDDYLRYTPHGLRHLAESVGLEVLLTYSPGNEAVAAGEMVGMKSAYWSMEHILVESDTHPLNVFLLARKPWSGRPTWRHQRRNGTRLS